MAKITKLPGQNIIDGFKGTLDFYVYMGIPCVRSWPRSPGHDRAPSVQTKWPPFAWASSNWNSLSTEIQDAYRRSVKGTSISGRDLFTKSFISASYVHLE